MIGFRVTKWKGNLLITRTVARPNLKCTIYIEGTKKGCTHFPQSPFLLSGAIGNKSIYGNHKFYRKDTIKFRHNSQTGTFLQKKRMQRKSPIILSLTTKNTQT